MLKKKILFVDDEPAVLELFGIMFKAMEDEWEILVATSGPQALDIMERERVEVVVSDMRMPGMNGAQLLNEVMERHPETTRMILSGYAEQESVAKCIGAAHQYLTKPCSVAALRSTLTRVCGLDAYLHNEKLKSLVARMGALPSLPSLYFRMLEELQSPTASLERIAELVAMDLGMTAKILQMVNSAFFGRPRNISDPAEAVQVLGVGTVRSLALSIHAFSCFDTSKLAEFSFEKLWNHSVTTAMFAKRVAQARAIERAAVDEAFIAGLLHDMGKLMMISNLPEDYRRAMQVCKDKSLTMSEAELLVFGASHPEVGAYLLGLWGLPTPIVEAVAYHHHPSQSPGRDFSPLAAVHIANVMEHELNASAGEPLTTRLDDRYLLETGMKPEIAQWRLTFAEAMQQPGWGW